MSLRTPRANRSYEHDSVAGIKIMILKRRQHGTKSN
jgi:hypothetical protein